MGDRTAGVRNKKIVKFDHSVTGAGQAAEVENEFENEPIAATANMVARGEVDPDDQYYRLPVKNVQRIEELLGKMEGRADSWARSYTEDVPFDWCLDQLVALDLIRKLLREGQLRKCPESEKL